MPVIYSIIESRFHPDFSALYKELNLTDLKFSSLRKAINELKTQPPDFVVAEFFYGFGSNYAGVNVSNLDVFLYSVQKYAPEAKVIVLVNKEERQYVEKLSALFSLHDVFTLPVSEKSIRESISDQ
ncbi:MAG: hypothetical protein OEX83_06550 [Gammaproteobacteria bacterium]|nr:hypothetical protein [Gammaproteobacteria bacterium]